MKYWGYLLLKLAAAGIVMRVVWVAIVVSFRGSIDPSFAQRPFGHDLGFTSVMLLYFLACFGVLHLIVRDQRYRCRTCLRRLRMPVARGSWPNMFLIGQPRTEYICLYGHGTLKVPEVRITSKSMDWESHGDDIWKELESLEETKR
jgi:hypothetical protein